MKTSPIEKQNISNQMSPIRQQSKEKNLPTEQKLGFNQYFERNISLYQSGVRWNQYKKQYQQQQILRRPKSFNQPPVSPVLKKLHDYEKVHWKFQESIDYQNMMKSYQEHAKIISDEIIKSPKTQKNTVSTPFFRSAKNEKLDTQIDNYNKAVTTRCKDLQRQLTNNSINLNKQTEETQKAKVWSAYEQNRESYFCCDTKETDGNENIQNGLKSDRSMRDQHKSQDYEYIGINKYANKNRKNIGTPQYSGTWDQSDNPSPQYDKKTLKKDQLMNKKTEKNFFYKTPDNQNTARIQQKKKSEVKTLFQVVNNDNITSKPNTARYSSLDKNYFEQYNEDNIPTEKNFYKEKKQSNNNDMQNVFQKNPFYTKQKIRNCQFTEDQLWQRTINDDMKKIIIDHSKEEFFWKKYNDQLRILPSSNLKKNSKNQFFSIGQNNKSTLDLQYPTVPIIPSFITEKKYPVFCSLDNTHLKDRDRLYSKYNNFSNVFRDMQQDQGIDEENSFQTMMKTDIYTETPNEEELDENQIPIDRELTSGVLKREQISRTQKNINKAQKK